MSGHQNQSERGTEIPWSPDDQWFSDDDTPLAPAPLAEIRWGAIETAPDNTFYGSVETPAFSHAEPIVEDSLTGSSGGYSFGAGHEMNITTAPFETVVEPEGLRDGPILIPGRSERFSELYQLGFRLTGSAELSAQLASAGDNAPAEESTGPASDSQAILTTLQAVLSANIPDEETIRYFQQRARLRRDLTRLLPREQMVVSLRHLVSRKPADVASRLALNESDVRTLTSKWNPTDAISSVDGAELLAGIDSWISPDLGTECKVVPIDLLSHLDDDTLR